MLNSFVRELKMILNHKLLFFITVFVLFSAPLRVYMPTSITLEVLIIGLCIYKSNGGRCLRLISPSSIVVVAFYLLIFLITVIADYTNDGSGFMNENYRFLVFLLLTCLMGNSKIDFLSLARCCLLCCKFHIFFTLFELIYLTILSPGDFYGVPIVGKAMPYFDSSSGYLNMNDNLLSYGFRPFGLMMQPQKTGFVFVVGAVLEYIVANVENRPPSIIWNILFVFISILQGAKTAFLILFVIEAAIFADFYPSRKISFGSVIFYISCLFMPLYIILNNVSLGNIGNDTNQLVLNEFLGFITHNPVNVFIGIGVPSALEIYSFGGAGECYFMRIIYNFGLPLTLLLFYFMSKWFLTFNRKTNYILVVTFVGLIFHYCVINVYFIGLAYASAICLSLYHERRLKTTYNI